MPLLRQRRCCRKNLWKLCLLECTQDFIWQGLANWIHFYYWGCASEEMTCIHNCTWPRLWTQEFRLLQFIIAYWTHLSTLWTFTCGLLDLWMFSEVAFKFRLFLDVFFLFPQVNLFGKARQCSLTENEKETYLICWVDCKSWHCTIVCQTQLRDFVPVSYLWCVGSIDCKGNE